MITSSVAVGKELMNLAAPAMRLAANADVRTEAWCLSEASPGPDPSQIASKISYDAG